MLSLTSMLGLLSSNVLFWPIQSSIECCFRISCCRKLFGDLKVGVGTGRIFRCLENTVWLALRALQRSLLSVEQIHEGTGVQTVSCHFSVVKLPHHTGMDTESVVELFSVSVVLV